MVNHASVIFSKGEVNLITDPWIEGSVFQEGWSLLATTKFTFEDFSRITHIWFSHEHPDHFFPPNIKKIPAEIKKNITVLYHKTNDRKVVEYCEKQGFKEVIELEPNKEYELAKDFSIINTPFGHDSWLYVKTEEFTYLNTNDCVLNTPEKISRVSKIVGQIDVLMTQFGYACKYGNIDEKDQREAAVQRKYNQMQLQIDTFKPSIFMPIASFVWFSHEENFYMNDAINTIDRVDRFISEQNIKPLVLYPGEVNIVGESHDNSSSIEKYMIDYSNISIENTRRTVSASFEEMSENASKLVDKIKKDLIVRIAISFHPVKIYLPDLNKTVKFSVGRGLREIQDKKENVNLIMTSEVLNYCLKFDWGFSTTNVNARFQTVGPKDLKLFNYYVSVTDSFNHEDSTWKRMVKKLFRKIGLKK